MSSLLVALQFGLMALMAVRLDADAVGPAFAALFMLGTAVGAWALSVNRPGNINIRPEPHPQGVLVTGGPYRWVRHPMYLAVLLMMAAFAMGDDPWQWAAWAARTADVWLGTGKSRKMMRSLPVLTYFSMRDGIAPRAKARQYGHW